MCGDQTATAAALAILGAASASWGWSWPPDPVFWALTALILTAFCVLGIAFQARSAEVDRAAKQLNPDRFLGLQLAAVLGYSKHASDLTTAQDGSAEPAVEWLRRVLVTRPDNRYVRVLLAAAMIDEPAATELDIRPEPHASVEEWNVYVESWNTLRQAHIRHLLTARALLDPLMARRSMPEHVSDWGKVTKITRALSAGWAWAVPDANVALLRARVGELLDEPSDALMALLEVAAVWCRDQGLNPLVGELSMGFEWLYAEHLLPTRTMPDVAYRLRIKLEKQLDAKLVDHQISL